jgi:lipoprotein-releasing system permease protein
MLKLFFWLRYLRKKKIVLLSVAAVALSCALLIVVASLFSGFIGAVEQTGREAFGDIYLDPWVQIPEHHDLLEGLEALPGVEAAAMVLDTYGLLYLGRGDVRAVRVLGIDPGKYAAVTGLKDSLLVQKNERGEPGFAIAEFPEEKTGFVSIGVLGKPDEETDEYDFEQIKTWLGKKIVLTTGAVVDKAQSVAGPGAERRFKRRVVPFRIADIVFQGVYILDSKDVYLPLGVVGELTGVDGSGRAEMNGVVKVKLGRGIDPGTMLGAVGTVWERFAREHGLPEYSVTKPLLVTYKEMQEYFVVELRKQMAVLMLIFGIVCSATVLLVFCIFYMMVMTRQRDIAVVKSCGAGSGSVASIFLGFGVCVGVIGAGFGTILGYVVTREINTIEEWIRVIFGLKLWKSSAYVFEKIPNQLDVRAACWIIAFAVVAAAVGALVPAIVAARTKPVDILRYD